MNYLKHLPNIITVFGIMLCLVLLGTVIWFPARTGVILLLSGKILLTDFFDGYLARRFNVVSKFGAAADRLRDKMFLLTMFLFVFAYAKHYWLRVAVVPLIAAESSLLLLWLAGTTKKMDVSAGIWGKIKMNLMSAGIVIYLACITAKGSSWELPENFWAPAVILVFTVSLIFAGKSLQAHVTQHISQL